MNLLTGFHAVGIDVGKQHRAVVTKGVFHRAFAAPHLVDQPLGVGSRARKAHDACAGKLPERLATRLRPRLGIDLPVLLDHFAMETTVEIGIGRGGVVVVVVGPAAVAAKRIELTDRKRNPPHGC